MDIENILKSNQTVKLKLSELVSDPGNSRVHDIHNLQVIKKSILRFGQYRPFVVQKSNHYIRVGNGMYQAMIQIAKQQNKELSDIQVNCVLVDLTDEQANILSVLDNKSSDLSYNDNTKLAQIFKNMNTENIELTGFSNQQVSKILENFNVNIDQAINPVDNVKSQDEKKKDQPKKGLLMYKLIFENEQQKNIWDKFINEVKGVYGQSVCESLKMFIVDYYKEAGKSVE